jgi:hypothetical protein
VTTTTSPKTLAFTGSNAGATTGLGVLLILAGGSIVGLTYRRRRAA